MNRRLSVLTLLAACVLALGLAACGGDEEGEVIDTGDGATGQTLDVTALDFEFDPSELTASSGDVTFALANDGSSPHALAVRGNDMDESSDVINGGDSTEFTVGLEDGTYEIYCPVGDHEDRGMVGTLTVGSGGGGGATTHDDTMGGTDTGGGDTAEMDTDEMETGGSDDSGTGSDDATNY